MATGRAKGAKRWASAWKAPRARSAWWEFPELIDGSGGRAGYSAAAGPTSSPTTPIRRRWDGEQTVREVSRWGRSWWSGQLGDQQGLVDGVEVEQDGADVASVAGGAGQPAQALDEQQGGQADRAEDSDLLVGPVLNRSPGHMVGVVGLSEGGFHAGLLGGQFEPPRRGPVGVGSVTQIRRPKRWAWK